jgi:UPF0176 protein
MSIRVAAFYKFTPLPHFKELQAPLIDALTAALARGTVLLAEEGFNGTLAAPADRMPDVIKALYEITGCTAFDVKYSTASKMPFKRLKVRPKKEIVTFGAGLANPQDRVGHYVEPKDWNELISDPDTVIIDTRNDYEVRIGSFKGAIDPHTERFGQFPEFVREQLKANKKQKIAMFCTGGIRCEKASSFMLQEGYENVYHLKGGILKYLEDVPASDSLWEGACFVFDERVGVLHGLQESSHSMCHGCLEPVSEEERSSLLYEAGVCCPKCTHRLTDKQKASSRERQKQFALARLRGSKHMGPREF